MVAADGSPLLLRCRLFDRYTHHLSLPLPVIHSYRAIPIPTAAARVERAARAAEVAEREARVAAREAREVTPTPTHTAATMAAAREERAAAREARVMEAILHR
jgi:hypothetical protein